jgi:hypothetical protein
MFHRFRYLRFRRTQYRFKSLLDIVVAVSAKSESVRGENCSHRPKRTMPYRALIIRRTLTKQPLHDRLLSSVSAFGTIMDAHSLALNSCALGYGQVGSKLTAWPGHAPQGDLGASYGRKIRPLLPNNSLFAIPFGGSARTVKGWQFTSADPNERLLDAPDWLQATTEQRPFAGPWCLESRPHDRLIEPLYEGGKMVIQATRGRLSLLARGQRTACGDLTASS